MSSRRDFQFKVCRNGDTENAFIEYSHQHDLEVTLKDVAPAVIVEKVTCKEIVHEKDIIDLVNELVSLHGLGEVMAVLVNFSSAESIVKELYEIDSSAVIQCVADNVSE